MSQVLHFSQFEQTASRADLVLALRQARGEAERFKQENIRLAAQCGHQKEEISDLTSDLFWMKEIIANKSLGNAHARVFCAVHQLTGELEARQDGLFRMYRGAISARAGVSDRTVSRVIAELASQGHLRRKIETSGGGDDALQKELYLAIPDSALQNPRGIELQDDDSSSDPPEKKVKVCRCGSTQIRRYVVCESCGEVQTEDDLIGVLPSTLEYEKELKARLQAELEYPLAHLEALAAEGKHAPNRACFRCGQRTWLPAYKDHQWVILCGSEQCYPFLLESAGHDLTPGPVERKESDQDGSTARDITG